MQLHLVLDNADKVCHTTDSESLNAISTGGPVMQFQNTDNVQKNLSEIISAIVNVDKEAVEDRLTQLSETEDLILLLENEELLDNIDKVVYCIKTGQEISKWNAENVSYLVQTLGKERALEVIKIKSHNQVISHWIFTDDKALEKLSDNDPVGYCVYAMATVLIPFDPMTQLIGTIREEEARKQLLEERIVAFKQLNKIPLSNIIRLNELMRRFLSITQSKAAYKHIAIPELRMIIATQSISYLEDFEQGLQETIANLIRDEFKRGRLKSNLTYQEVMDLSSLFKGHANFRNQKRLKSMTETEHVAFLLKDFMPNMTPVQVQIKSGNEPGPIGVKLKIHKGDLTLNIQEPEKKPIKLSFAQILKRRV